MSMLIVREEEQEQDEAFGIKVELESLSQI